MSPVVDAARNVAEAVGWLILALGCVMAVALVVSVLLPQRRGECDPGPGAEVVDLDEYRRRAS